jgi:hypothetical protein
VTNGSQEFAGNKTFGQLTTVAELLVQFGVEFTQANNAALTGANAELATVDRKPCVRLTNGSLTSIATISSQTNMLMLLINDTGNAITINNNSGGTNASDRILTGTGANYSMPNGSMVFFYYDDTSSRWRMLGGGGGSSAASGISNTPSGNLAATDVQAALNELQSDINTRVLDSDYTADLATLVTGIDAKQVKRYTATFTGTSVTPSAGGGDSIFTYTGGSAQTFTGFGTIGTLNEGVQVDLIGTSDTNTLSISESDASDGWLMNGPIELTKATRIKFEYNSTIARMIEVSRSVR